MTDYVDNVLCDSDTPEPTSQPTCVSELEYSEDLMDKLCSVDATGLTFKHYDSINRAPVSCSGILEDTLDLRKSLANQLFDNCGAWCVFDWNTQALEAWFWEKSQFCWKRKSYGFCFYDYVAKTSTQIVADALAKLASICDIDTSACYKEHEWTKARAEVLCSSLSYGHTNKSYSGAHVCSDDSDEQIKLGKSLANSLYDSCSSWCVYDWDTLISDIDDAGGYKWDNSGKCYRWVTDGSCFARHGVEYEAVRAYILETCTYRDLLITN